MRNGQELHLFVQKKLRRGYPQGELVNDLLKEGYTEKEIGDAIYKAAAGTKGSGASANNPVWFVITTGLGIAGISIVSVSYFAHFHLAGYLLIAIGATGIFIKFLIPFLNKKD